MIDFSYNISEKHLKSLVKIDELRVRILTAGISPKDELRLRWEARVDRIYGAFSLSGKALSKHQITKLLQSGKSRKFNSDEQQAVDYKKAFDYLVQNWLVSPSNVSVRTIVTLRSFIGRYAGYPASRESEIKSLLEFLQSKREHSVIISGIALIQLLAINGGKPLEVKLPILAAYLFFYKSGYDFRGLLRIEEGFLKNRGEFKEKIEATLKSHNLTIWLEFYARLISGQLEEALKDIKSLRFRLEIPSKYWEINNRQREILTILDAPDKSITNRKVQQLFNVSQITASRDLVGMELLGLIFVHGKGRSVYYTRV
ncbi:MAG: hypothetical protein UV73_C0014G0004 [Candidatus Gottesmanbacteria bacterium GW2011_GWA2_43_14]|uniref:Fido domain-containing protein n=1 Tax=Candidatus Gottesmanbacteria bacterium GW2011_GWA2_43_14 TaxID=1618443 RepID=A0A0G1DDP6_9BACT|nr:MAG: hypothetical protein UV73_C0014G0004 [Candidatus Gottesmanbacteria bacterium GW2011_GWA2_43_14]